MRFIQSWFNSQARKKKKKRPLVFGEKQQGARGSQVIKERKKGRSRHKKVIPGQT